MKTLTGQSSDGTYLAIKEWGNPAGPELLFIHGFAQSGDSWQRQVTSSLAEDFRIITFDLRGHGESDKPARSEAYRDPRRWADDLAAVMSCAELRRPVLIGWSYGGRVICDYLAHYGEGGIAGINFVAATSTGKPGVFGPVAQHIAQMLAEDLSTRTAGTTLFLQACSARPLSAEGLAAALAYNLAVPPQVLRFLLDRPAVYDEVLRRITVPVLVTQGCEDLVVLPTMSEHTLSLIKHAQRSFYAGIGHTPFYEAADRFNLELAEFGRATVR